MAEIKLTKNELRAQQVKLSQLQKYLPTLQLKKAMLQSEVQEARLEIKELEDRYAQQQSRAERFAPLLSEKTAVDPMEAGKILEVKKRWENIAGVEVPYFEDATFNPLEYSLFDTPAWVDGAIIGIRDLAKAKASILVAHQKKAALEAELREVSIRVNLFEKVLIPRAQANIKRIKVFLGDQELSAVSQAKVAKNKIEAKKAEKLEAVVG